MKTSRPITRLAAVVIAAIAGIFTCQANTELSTPAPLPVENAILTSAPNVPPAITRTTAAKVIVNL